MQRVRKDTGETHSGVSMQWIFLSLAQKQPHVSSHTSTPGEIARGQVMLPPTRAARAAKRTRMLE